MKTDRELLELAAKAVGAEWSDYPDRTPNHWEMEKPDGVWSVWNPLTDDGDALRLAAKLRLTISPGKHKGDGCTVEAPRGIAPGCTAFRDDDAEQMRYAIVHVAASIGETMP